MSVRRQSSPLSPMTPDEKSEFFLTASHQLKSPVAIMQWVLQTVLESPTLDANNRTLIQKALAQADAMSAFIRDMLHIFKLGSQDLLHNLEPVQVHEVLAESLKQCEDFAQRQQVHLLQGPIEKLPTIYAHTGYIKQALINLIDNAIKYSKKGGKVEVVAHTHHHWVEISVIDNGIGIAESDQGRLFTEFFRGEQAKEVHHEGTGLGLVLVKHIVETFGGEIVFVSKLHHGSTFTIRLPFKS